MSLAVNLYLWSGRNRFLQQSLNIFGAIARAVSHNYLPGRSRVAAQIIDRQSTHLVLSTDGLLADGNLVADSSFVAERLLARGLTSVVLGKDVSLRQLLNFTRSVETVSTANISGQTNQIKANELYQSVAYKNFQNLLKVNATSSIVTNLVYFAYFLSSGISPYAHNVFDYVLNIGMFIGISFFSLFNISKQYTTLRGIKYAAPCAEVTEQEFAVSPQGPRVTILVPVVAEPKEVVKTTLENAVKQDYHNFEIVLLIDDEQADNYQQMVEAVAEVNATLPEGVPAIKTFARKRYANVLNKERNKADNVNAFLTYALGKSLTEVPTESGQLKLQPTEVGAASLTFQACEYLAIIDADDKIAPNFLRETVPIMARESHLAVLQTAKSAEIANPNPLEEVGSVITNSLWQVFQRGVDANKAMYCGGTGCVLRLTALESIKRVGPNGKVEYFSTSNITEDLALSLKLLEQRWEIRLLNKRLCVGLPANNLADHFTQYWRYVEGPMELTLSQIIPRFFRDRYFAFSRQGFEFLMKGIQPLYGWFLGLFQLLPLAVVFGSELPIVSPYIFTPLWLTLFLFNSNVTKLYAQSVKGKAFDHLKVGILMFLHFPVFCHASLAAVKNRTLDRTAQFLRTAKDGTRARVPLKYLVPLLTATSLNTLSLGLSLTRFVSSEETWLLQPAFWSLMNIGICGYGLAKFNGIKHTAKDLYYGVRNLISGPRI